MMQSGKGLVQNPAKHSGHPQAKLNSSPGPSVWESGRGGAGRVDRVDMVDSYFAVGVTSAAVTSVEHPGLDTGRRVSLAGGANRDKARVVSVEEADSDENSQEEFGNGHLTTRSIAPPEMPGLSIITWDEFIEDPSMFYRLFSSDKRDFIHFDSQIVANFFHDSRMDPPLLGGPSGDGMSWTIFVDSYNQLQELREFLTSRISVLLVDLIKPHGGGTAACLLAINPHDDHIRRVLHLTLSRAMQTMMAERCFSIEIDLNESVEGWCRTVLQSDCMVHGGRIVITNGEAAESCCEVDSPKHCVLCFPVWAFRRIKYTIQRRRHYDDTRLEFESSSIVLCTKSDKLRKSSEAAQLMNGGKVLGKNKHSVTMATQTFGESRTSLRSDMSVEDVGDDVTAQLNREEEEEEEENEDEDNDVFDEATPDERGGLTPAPPPVDEYRDDESDDDQPNSGDTRAAPGTLPTGKITSSSSGSGGISNPGFVTDDSGPGIDQKNLSNFRIQSDSSQATEQKTSAIKDPSRADGTKKKGKSVAFQWALTTENPPVASRSALVEEEASKPSRISFSQNSVMEKSTAHTGAKPQSHVMFLGTKAETEEEVPSPRTAFLLRPDTPFVPKQKPRQTPVKAFPLDNTQSANATPLTKDKEAQDAGPGKPSLPWIGQSNPGNTRNSAQINDKIAKRQRKIGLLLKDLVLSSSTVPRGKPKFLDNSPFSDEDVEDRLGAKNTMFATSNFQPGGPRGGQASEKVSHTPVKGWDQETDKVFPYTSDLLSFPAVSSAATGEDLERYGAHAKKKRKGKLKQTEDGGNDDNMLFKPRHNLLNLDAFGPDRNCFSDQDVNDSDITDLETEPESAISDTEGITSSRLIPVTRTSRTVSIDAVNEPTSGLANTTASDIDTDLEVTDCEVEEEALAQKLRGPRILPGAQAAHELNASRSASAKSRDYIPPSAQARRRGGSQNDSRRRYLALNSLRRKAYELKQVSRTKTSPKPKHRAELLSYNTRRTAQVTIMSQV